MTYIPARLGTLSVVTDYTIPSNLNYSRIVANPNTASQYGILEIELPPGGSSDKLDIPIFSGANEGIVKIVPNGSDKINYKGQQKTYMYLFLPNQRAKFSWNGTDWNMSDYCIGLYSGYVNTDDWTNRHLGFSNFDYDNQSDSTDLTGMSLIEATSNNTGIVFSDSNPTGNSGTLTVYNVTGTGIFTNERVVTFVNSVTADVNEPAGSNKNDDNNNTHGLNINLKEIVIDIYFSTDGTENNSEYALYRDKDNSVECGIGVKQIDTNQIKEQTGVDGIRLFNDGGGGDRWTTENYYYNVRIFLL